MAAPTLSSLNLTPRSAATDGTHGTTSAAPGGGGGASSDAMLLSPRSLSLPANSTTMRITVSRTDSGDTRSMHLRVASLADFYTRLHSAFGVEVLAVIWDTDTSLWTPLCDMVQLHPSSRVLVLPRSAISSLTLSSSSLSLSDNASSSSSSSPSKPSTATAANPVANSTSALSQRIQQRIDALTAARAARQLSADLHPIDIDECEQLLATKPTASISHIESHDVIERPMAGDESTSPPHTDRGDSGATPTRGSSSHSLMASKLLASSTRSRSFTDSAGPAANGGGGGADPRLPSSREEAGSSILEMQELLASSSKRGSNELIVRRKLRTGNRPSSIDSFASLSAANDDSPSLPTTPTGASAAASAAAAAPIAVQPTSSGTSEDVRRRRKNSDSNKQVPRTTSLLHRLVLGGKKSGAKESDESASAGGDTSNIPQYTAAAASGVEQAARLVSKVAGQIASERQLVGECERLPVADALGAVGLNGSRSQDLLEMLEKQVPLLVREHKIGCFGHARQCIGGMEIIRWLRNTLRRDELQVYQQLVSSTTPTPTPTPAAAISTPRASTRSATALSRGGDPDEAMFTFATAVANALLLAGVLVQLYPQSNTSWMPFSNGGLYDLASSSAHKRTLRSPVDLVQQIATGRHSELYWAREHERGLAMVIKTAPWAFDDKAILLAKEAKLLALFECEQIPRSVSWREEFSLCMALEPMFGGSVLTHFITRGHFSERDVASVVRTVAHSLSYLRSKQYVLNNLELRNVLVTHAVGERWPPEVRVVDYSQAVSLVYQNTFEYRHPTLSAAFAAPEQLQGLACTYSVDVWRLGVCMFVLLTGHLPFFATEPEQLARQLEHRVTLNATDWAPISYSAREQIGRAHV